MDRGSRRGNDSRRRDDRRDHKPRYERDRSRSPPPPARDRRDDRRRERSPPRGPPSRGGGPPHRSDRDSRDYNRGARDHTPPASRGGRAGPGGGGDRRQPLDPRTVNPAAPRPGPKDVPASKDTRMQDGLEDEDSEAEMQRLLGFKGFRSTKNTKVPGNDKNYAVSKAKKSEYRQYMNRVGGFNRPLSPSRM
ncbi:hypothetical protein LTR37_018224 [Vermiconidia calcicola]|uniref:Uncharacterized protein n=1 Tax=Vermiconidia calcicola TaxID=1690605 RepID=A0ACC3MIX2_9PEZI|nr:hypothetical protein LTR37_018224 [Vermiconidia calcicola]